MESILDIFNVTEYVDGFNTNFILNNNNQFSVTDYKVIRGQMKGGLVRCEKVMFNGQVKLLYLTDGYTSLDYLLPRMDEKKFFGILADILRVLIDIKENGFLDLQRLLLLPEYIFVDTSTMKVQLIYLPMDLKVSPSFAQLYQIRPVLIRLVHATVRLSSMTVQRLTMMLSEERMSLQDIRTELLKLWDDTGAFTSDEDDAPPEPEKEKVLYMTSINPDYAVKFRIDKRDFSIGREAGRVDGVIVGSSVVGRNHCSVRYIDKKYYIEDNSSKNGTFLNEKKLIAGEPKEITEKSFIRIANITFKIKFE